MHLIEQRVTTAVLLVINMVLVVLVLLSLETPLDEAAASDAAGMGEEPRIELPAARLQLAQLESYQGIIERPLFWSERRNPEESPALTADAPQAAPPFVLIGVVTGSKNKALLVKPGGKEVTRASEGDVVEGWRIEAVGRQSVTLASGSLRRELQVGPGVATGK